MEITRFDITVLVATSTAIILMSLVFPPMGLVDAGNTTNTSEIPKFSMDSSRFDISGDFPTRPGANASGSQSGTLAYNNPEYPASTFIFGDTGHGDELLLYNRNTSDNTQVVLILRHWEGGEPTADNATEQGAAYTWDEANITQEGQFESLTIGPLGTHNGNATANMTITEFEDAGTSSFTVTGRYSYTAEDLSSGGFGLTDVPIIGDFVEAGSNVSAAVIWIAEIVLWGFIVAFELLLNGISVILDVVTFLFAMTTWLVSTYTSITTANNLQSWAQLVLLIPSVLFAMVWAKLAVVAFDAIWIG